MYGFLMEGERREGLSTVDTWKNKERVCRCFCGREEERDVHGFNNGGRNKENGFRLF